jgi:hypothetical protein
MNPYGQPPPVNPYAAPQAPIMPTGYGATPMSARVEGKALVVANGSAFPPLCLKCGTPQGLEWRDQKYTYVPPWARLFGALIQVFVMKRSRSKVPVCQPCNQQWKKANLLLWLAILGGVVLWIFAGVGAGAAGEEAGGTIGVVFGVLGFVVFFGGIIAFAIVRQKRVVSATRIDKQFTWLTGIHGNAIQAIVGGGYPQGGGYVGGGYPMR